MPNSGNESATLVGEECDHDWCLWHESDIDPGQEVRWCRECEITQYRSKEDP